MTATLEAADTAGTSDDFDTGDDSGGGQPPRPVRPVPAPLAPWRDPHPRMAWLGTAVITVLAVLTRFWSLGFPPGRNSIPKNGMNFDEVYYAVEAQEILRFGYEDNRGYMFIVHPTLGKLLIALSEKLWDNGSSQYLTNSIGWRIAPALAGCAGVIMLMRIVRRMMHSNLFGFIAGLLMALEGMSLVLARTAILDIFLQTFVIASFGAMVIDRDKMRARLGALVADGADLTGGAPTLGPRPWRIAAGVLLACACAVKWTGAFFFIAFVLMTLIWDRAALKSAGVRRPLRSWARRSILPALGSLGLAPIATYLLTYLGWFAGENSWNRHWADSHSTSARLNLPFGIRIPFNWGWVPGPLRSLGWNHLDAYRFHEGLDSGHTYASNPWSWLVLGRPVDFYYNSSNYNQKLNGHWANAAGQQSPCGATSCSREVLLIGTPLMWWAFVPMLLWLAWHWITTRDWRAGAVWVAFAAGWLVWFPDLKRTMFLFYMAPLVPFLVIGLTLALGVMIGPGVKRARGSDGTSRHLLLPGTDSAAERARRRRLWGIGGVTVFLALVVVDFVWMWPIFTGGLRSYDVWHAHMWLPSWV